MEKLHIKGAFELECGRSLPELRLAYKTHGQLNEDGSNVIWICHALTANADPVDWWPGMVGAGRVFDPARYFIVCANIIGSCYGSTFAADTDPATGQPYGAAFPLIAVRDQVRAMSALADSLGVSEIYLGIGASLGGQQLLEWAALEPNRFRRICPIATNARHSPWGIAFNEAQRMAILADPTLYDTANPEAGWQGMAAARAVAMLSYRNYATYQATQLDDKPLLENFKAASYQRYQGEKLCKRFHPWAYLSLSRMMDSHDIGRDRGGEKAALTGISAAAMVIGIESDLLFPLQEQRFLAQHIPHGFLKIVNSKYGHDGFLIEYDILTDMVREFLEE